MSQKQSKKNNKDLVLQFTNFLKFKKGLSANTISAYESDITQFLEFTGENIINNDLWAQSGPKGTHGGRRPTLWRPKADAGVSGGEAPRKKTI